MAENINVVLFVVGLVLAVIGYLVRSKLQSVDTSITQLTDHKQQQQQQQAVDDSSWRRQSIINLKVEDSDRKIAVIESRVVSLHNNMDDLKKDIKEVGLKIDQLLQRK